MTPSTASRVDLRREVEELYYREAWLLDHDKLEQWLELFTPDVRYWAPVRMNLPRGEEDFSQPFITPHFDENYAGLQFRVARSRTGMAFAEEYVRVRRFISNVLILENDERTARVSSNFQLFKSRQDEQWFVGARDDRLARNDDGVWRIRERMVVLDHSVIDSITVYI
jgi:dibenzofuran dioxygenase beta subunit